MDNVLFNFYMVSIVMNNLPVNALGLMSGTSLDGIDVALISTNGEQICEFGPWCTVAYSEELKGQIRSLILKTLGRSSESIDAKIVEKNVTKAHISAVEFFLSDNDLSFQSINLIGFHGQTIIHNPVKSFTWQIGDGAFMATELGIDVVNDFRSADVVAGGQGAPFTPLYHKALANMFNFNHDFPLVFLNLGGVANITWIGSNGDLLAFDTGPGCGLIDDLVLQRFGMAFDNGGSLAASGSVDKEILDTLLAHVYFITPPPKSLDRYDFNVSPIMALDSISALSTLVAFTVETVAMGLAACPEKPKKLVVSGGGRHNDFLINAIEKRINIPVSKAESCGLRGDSLEAEAFAYLAVRSLHGYPLSLPETTGTSRPCIGGRLNYANPD